MNQANEAFRTAAGVSVDSLSLLILGAVISVLLLVSAYILKEQLKAVRAGASFDEVLKIALRIIILIILVSVFLKI